MTPWSQTSIDYARQALRLTSTAQRAAAAGWIAAHAQNDERLCAAFVAGMLAVLTGETPAPPAVETIPAPGNGCLASYDQVVDWCRKEGYTDLDKEKPRFKGNGQYSLEHEPGAVWLFFPKSPQAPVRARLKRAGFKGKYEGTRIDKRGKTRPNFAGWRFAAG